MTDSGGKIRMDRMSLEVSEELLRAVGSVLDIRQVFPDVSAIVQRVLPHDRLTMTLHDGGSALIAHAFSNDDGPFLVKATGFEIEGMDDGSAKIVRDMTAEATTLTFEPPDYRDRAKAAGYRSALSVLVRRGSAAVCAALLVQAGRRLPRSRTSRWPATLLSTWRSVCPTNSWPTPSRRAAAARARAERLEARIQALSNELDSRSGYGCMAGESPAWKHVVRAATQVAATDTTVLLTGESGTGKEVVARYIHRASARSHGPFGAVNCAALPETLLESELFGHERGAFTGAEQRSAGQIESAAGGVLLLDEVSEMSLSAQVKFLRVLQEREFHRLGGTQADQSRRADHRRDATGIWPRRWTAGTSGRISTTASRCSRFASRRCASAPRTSFRLTAAFLEDIGRSFGRTPAGITREAKEILLTHSWRGNARELRNVLERAAIVSEGGLIAPEHLAIDLTNRPPDASADRRQNDGAAAD